MATGGQAAGDAPARLRRPDRGRRQRRQGLGARQRNRSAACTTCRRDAADPRPEPARRPVSQGRAAAERPAARTWPRRRQARQIDGPLRPHRAARAAADADARRSRGLQRRPEHRPPGQGHAEEHRQRRRRRAGPSTATPAATTATAARPTPRRTPTTRGGKSISAPSSPSSRSSIYNRTDGSLGKRLDGFTLKVLDDRPQRRLRARRS